MILATGAKLVISGKFYTVIKEFIDGKKTGQIVLNIKDGNVLVVDIKESVRLPSG